MGGRPEDDAEAPTLAQVVTPLTPTVLAGRSSRPEIESLSPGATIGRYRLARRLGAGAMGIVWSAHDPQLDRSIAIKLVHPSLARSDEAASRFLREARAMAKLSHRSVITVHDAGDVEGQLFIAMEMIDGVNLGTLLRGRSAEEVLDWRRWLAIMVQAGEGLAAAHKSGVLHRDFKPDNVLVDNSGRVAVGDFGLATLGDETFAGVLSQRADKTPDPALVRAGDQPIDLTTTGTLLGTPAYMSPQQLRSEPIDARADQFSFCVATWEALYGARPFTVTRDSLDAVLELAATIETGALPDPPAGSTVPAKIRDVLARGLAPTPGKRWPDMGALLAALEAAIAGEAEAVEIVTRPVALRRRRLLWLAGAVAVAGVITAFAVGRRGASESEPRAAVTPPPPPAHARPPASMKKLFNVSFRTGMVLSPDGTRMALNSDRLQVREVDGKGLWSTLLPGSGDEVNHAEFEGDDLRFSVRLRHAVFRWNYAGTGETRIEVEDLGGYWHGKTVLGELVYHSIDKVMSIVDNGRVVRRWQLTTHADGPTPSPDKKRVMYVEAGRFTGTIVIRDIESERVFRSEVHVSPTAVTWVDDQTLLYAIGTLEQPRVMRVSIAGEKFGTPTEVFGLEAGWFGPMAVRGTRLFQIQMQPSPRARLIDRRGDATSTRDLDHASVSLGWIADREYLSWSRNAHRVERRAERAIELTKAVLDGEPANATNAGDVLIAAMRRPAGREALGVSLSTGTQLWRHQDGRTLAVRCAEDLHPPCFAIRALDGEDQVVTLDPNTGELGTTPIHRGKAEDVAVSADGKRLVIVSLNDRATEIDSTGKVIATFDVPISTLRSVAFDPRGGLLFGGTRTRNNYMVGRLHEGVWTLLMQTDDDILSFVRPSPDGDQVLVLARVYAPEVWQIQLAEAP